MLESIRGEQEESQVYDSSKEAATHPLFSMRECPLFLSGERRDDLASDGRPATVASIFCSRGAESRGHSKSITTGLSQKQNGKPHYPLLGSINHCDSPSLFLASQDLKYWHSGFILED